MLPRIEKWYWILLAILALAGLGLDLYITRNGAGITGDGVWYVQGAENILGGHGFSLHRGDGYLPITEFPSFYSIVLAGLGIFGGSIYAIGRYLGAVLLAVNIFLAGWMIHRMSRSTAWAFFGSLLVLLSTSTLIAHAWILTEALYISLTLACLMSVLFYLESGRFLPLAIGGLIAGLSIITRYAGVALLAFCCLSLLFFGRGGWKKRMLQAAAVGLIGLLPAGIWILRNALLGLDLAGRSGIALRIPPMENFVAFFSTVWDWVYPDKTSLTKILRFIILSVTFLLLGVPLYFALFRSGRVNRFRHPRLAEFILVLGLLDFLYIAVIFLSISLSLAGSPFYAEHTQIGRYLIPAFVVFAISVSLGLFVWTQVLGVRRLLRALPVVMALYLAGLYLVNFNVLRTPPYMGYPDVQQSQPDLVAALEAVDPARPIVTNDYEQILFLSGRPVYSIPGFENDLTGIPNPQLPLLMQTVTALIDRGALVVIQRSTPTEKNFFDPLLATLRPVGTYGQFTFYEK
jgi:hypothetical protein